MFSDVYVNQNHHESSVSKVAHPPDKSLVEYASDVLLDRQTRSAGRAQNVVIIHLNKHNIITNTWNKSNSTNRGPITPIECEPVSSHRLKQTLT